MRACYTALAGVTLIAIVFTVAEMRAGHRLFANLPPTPATVTQGIASPQQTPTPATRARPPHVPDVAVGVRKNLNAPCPAVKVTTEQTNGRSQGYWAGPITPHAASPVVVVLHGGVVPSAGSGDWQAKQAADEYSSHLCASGFAIFSVDYRASSIGGDEMLDIAGAYDYVASRADVDRSRIYISGTSSGGYLAMEAISAPEFRRPYAGAVDLYGFVDAAGEVRREPWDLQVQKTVRDYGAPLQNSARYAEVSPIDHLSGIAVPILIVIGGDDRALLPELERFRDLLRGAGKHVEFIVVPGAPHSFEFRPRSDADVLWAAVSGFLSRLAGHH